MEAFKGMIEVMSQLVDDCVAMMKLISGKIDISHIMIDVQCKG